MEVSCVRRASRHLVWRLVAALGTVLLFTLIAAPRALADVTPSVTASFPTTTAVSRHSDWRQVIDFSSSDDEDVKRLIIDAPTGQMGNPTAIPSGQRCSVNYTLPAKAYNLCPASSDVGDISVTAVSPLFGELTLTGNVFLLNNVPSPAPEVPTHLGIHVSTLLLGLIPLSQDLTAEIVPRKSDTGLRITVLEDIPRTDPFGLTPITITKMDQVVRAFAPNGGHFLYNPSRCDTWTTAVYTRAYDSNSNADVDIDPGIPGDDHKQATSDTLPDCSNPPPLEASLEVTRTTTAAGAPTGIRTALVVPNDDPIDPHPPYVKESELTLPKGFEINPAIANGVGDVGCTDEQFNKADPDAQPTCPAGTQVGTVEVVTPLVSTPQTGAVYLGSPGSTREHRYRLLVHVSGGVNIKLEWRSYVADDGQVSVKLGDPAVDRFLPQFPFTSFALEMNSGPRALVTNPQACGTYTATLTMTPWNPQPAITRTADLPVTAGDNGSCDFDPFEPTFAAELSNTTAGSATDLTLTTTRDDRQDNLRSWHVALPSGLVGSLRAAPLCPAATADVGGCGADSQVGTVDIELGSGSETISLAATVHIAEGGVNEVARLTIQVPTKVGPFDLGVVPVQTSLSVRADGGIDALTAALPSSVQGVPARYRRISVKLLGELPNGARFVSTPTACTPVPINSTLTSVGEPPAAGPTAVTHVDNDQSITGCEQLPFGPGFSFGISSGTRNTQPQVDIGVTLPAGDANIRRVYTSLPPVFTVNTDALTNLCPRAALAARACPPLSRMGSVALSTPLLPFPLTGSAYIVTGTLQLPDLALVFAGPGIDLAFVGTNDLVNNRIISTFDGLPDLAFDRLDLRLDSGPRGLLKLARCPRDNGPIDVAIQGQGGRASRCTRPCRWRAAWAPRRARA